MELKILTRNFKSPAKILVLLREDVYPWILDGIIYVYCDVCFSILEFFIFSMAQKLTSEMSIIIFQETALGFDCTKDLQFLKRKKQGQVKFWAFLNIRHFNVICQYTKFSHILLSGRSCWKCLQIDYFLCKKRPIINVKFVRLNSKLRS